MNIPLLALTFSVIGFFIQTTAHGAEETILATSGPSKVALIELYSSESCSSCPPADQWISGLELNKELWSKFVPVVFHVDYWNHLNWKDNFSSKEQTSRQIAVSKKWPRPSVYTPSVVVNGAEWQNWRRSVIENRIPKTHSAITLQILRDNHGDLIVAVSGRKPTAHYIVHLAKLGMGISSKITKGENSGKTLDHNFVVLDWQHQALGSTQRTKPFTIATNDKAIAKKYAIVAWIEDENQPISLQATGAYL